MSLEFNDISAVLRYGRDLTVVPMDEICRALASVVTEGIIEYDHQAFTAALASPARHEIPGIRNFLTFNKNRRQIIAYEPEAEIRRLRRMFLSVNADLVTTRYNERVNRLLSRNFEVCRCGESLLLGFDAMEDSLLGTVVRGEMFLKPGDLISLYNIGILAYGGPDVFGVRGEHKPPFTIAFSDSELKEPVKDAYCCVYCHNLPVFEGFLEPLGNPNLHGGFKMFGDEAFDRTEDKLIRTVEGAPLAEYIAAHFAAREE